MFVRLLRRSMDINRYAALIVVAVLLTSLGTAAGQDDDGDARLRLRATPNVAFAPASVLFVGQIRGGPDDNEELYCPTVEWEWDDDTISSQTVDCDPFEPGVTEIQRRFSVRHTFDYAGQYDVRLHLKQGDDVVITSRVRVEIRGNNRRFR
uniref:PKD domain-containing protein n=1 Tax=uncultured marine thaumarchaeote KM3_68_B04 TaxID=1456242 RepID=A0A075HI37_9ARCH|nr:hypothetical protein [uncultured marine thaumarchaeote KM3_68_B04]